jgi:hypothetical protein
MTPFASLLRALATKRLAGSLAAFGLGSEVDAAAATLRWRLQKKPHYGRSGSKVELHLNLGGSTMSILVRFTGAPSVDQTQMYEEVNRRLESAGDFPPEGLEFHVAFESGGSFRVSEIWDSREQFEKFGQRLMPILADVGIELAGEPEILEVYNIIKR